MQHHMHGTGDLKSVETSSPPPTSPARLQSVHVFFTTVITPSATLLTSLTLCTSVATGACASAGNRTRVTSMATMYSTTRPPMLVIVVCINCIDHPPTPLEGPRHTHVCGAKHAHCLYAPSAHARGVSPMPPSCERTQCIGRESSPGHIDGNDVLYH